MWEDDFDRGDAEDAEKGGEEEVANVEPESRPVVIRAGSE